MLHSQGEGTSGGSSRNNSEHAVTDPSVSQQLRPDDQRLAILAHQGVQGELPPNSLAALEQAFHTADVVECDIYTAPDSSEIVVIHPESFFLFVDKNGMQNEKPIPIGLDELRAVNVRGHQLVPTLNEVLDVYTSIPGRKAELHIELKGPGTAEAVVPLLRQRVESGELAYEDFLLTGLCYKGDEKSRIEVARELDPEARLVLVVRGGDLESEGFDGWQGVIEKGKELQVEVITAARKFLTPEIVAQLRDAGFEVGCYHSRTSDELEAALALETDVVAADFFCGASVEDYPHVRKNGSPLFAPLQEAGYYHMRDLIWELGWKLESQRDSWPNVDQGPGKVQADAGVLHREDQLIAKLLHEGVESPVHCDLSRVLIPEEFLGDIDRTVFSTTVTFSELLSPGGQLRLRDSLLDDFLDRDVPGVSEATVDFLTGLSVRDFLRIGDGVPQELLREVSQPLDETELSFCETFSRDFAVRTGRLLGMLGFTALNPRHGAKDSYTVAISSPLLDESSWARQGAHEQVQAQLLRSGKMGEVEFLSS